MKKTVTLIHKLSNFLNLILNSLSIYRIMSLMRLVACYVLKKDTKYPSHLINFENKISNLNNKKYTLSFSSGTLGFESLIKSFNLNDKKVGTSNIVFPSIFSVLTRYVKTGNLKIIKCNKDLVLDFEGNIELIKSLDYLLITFAYGYSYNSEIIDKIFSINEKIILIYDLSHCQGYSEENSKKKIQTHYFFSTQGSKSISTGEGGIVSTDDYNIFKKMILNSHLNRFKNDFKLSDKEILAVKIGLLSKSRMNPIGAISGLNDIFYLEKNNKLLRKKISIIYKELGKLEKIYLPKIDNFEKLYGFHYGVPFIINNKLTEIQKNNFLSEIGKYFKVLSYNWLYTENLEKLTQLENLKKFNDYKFDFLNLGKENKNDDDLKNLYFIDLNFLKVLPIIIIKYLVKKIDK